MALYAVVSKGSPYLIRARNGDRARAIIEDLNADVSRINENGPEGVIDISPDAQFAGPGTDEDDAEASETPQDEIDISTMDDPPGTRRLKNIFTKQERLVSVG